MLDAFYLYEEENEFNDLNSFDQPDFDKLLG